MSKTASSLKGMSESTTLTPDDVKAIKRHKAYDYHVYREEECNSEIVKIGCGDFRIQDYAEGDYPKMEERRGSLKDCLDTILRSNIVADKNEQFHRTWYIRGL